jgi:SAM-dependent methyltransferase
MMFLHNFAKVTRKLNGLSAIKAFNRVIRKVSSCTHHFQHIIEWETGTTPEWYDHFLNQHWNWSGGMPWERGFFSALALKKGGRALELCCGDGFNAHNFYADHLSKMVAVDFDELAIKHAKKNFVNPKISYEVCDIRTSLPSGPFDNIIWDAAIEHFTEAEIAKLVVNIKKILKEDGILSGYTIVEKSDGTKSHNEHEYEFSSKEDLRRFFSPHFRRVQIFETFSSDRHNLYFYASNKTRLPLDSD